MSAALALKTLTMWPSIKVVGIGGGEPLLNADVADIVDVCLTRVHRVDLFTNGTLAKDVNLPWSRFRLINVSMTDRLTKAADGLRHIREAGGNVVASFVVTRNRLDKMVDDARYAKLLGVQQVAFQSLLIPAGVGQEFFQQSIIPAHLPTIRQQLRQVAKLGMTVKQTPTPYRVKTSGRGCTMASDYVAVDGAGNVALCCVGPGPRPEMGNVREGVDVWATGAMAELRKRVYDPKRQPKKCLSCRSNRAP